MLLKSMSAEQLMAALQEIVEMEMTKACIEADIANIRDIGMLRGLGKMLAMMRLGIVMTNSIEEKWTPHQLETAVSEMAVEVARFTIHHHGAEAVRAAQMMSEAGEE